MDYVNLGKTGLRVSRICLGCMSYGAPATGKAKPGSHAWALDEEESEPFFRPALDLGINFFDAANVYSGGASEEVLGRFLKANIRREAVVIATKVHGVMRDEPNGRGLSRKAIFYELDQSLRRLQTDYVDLYQIHRRDYETPIEETLEALNDVVKSGKVRYIGASSMRAWQFTKSSLSDRPSRLDPFRFRAESLQPALSRRGARGHSPLPVRGYRRHSLEPAGARPPGPSVAKRTHQTLRNGPVRKEHVLAHRRS
jgi:aryl-alcohol dehydrogenase-like predicted oxidoreductase